MSWIENMTINIFPMVLVIVVLVSNRFKLGKARSARLFDHIIIFDFMLMLVDIIGVGMSGSMVEDVVNKMWIINVLRMLLTIFLTTTWLVYVCLKISLDGADRRILPIISIVTAIGVIASFVVLLIPHDYLTAYGLQNAGRGLRICYLAVSYYGICGKCSGCIVRCDI